MFQWVTWESRKRAKMVQPPLLHDTLTKALNPNLNILVFISWKLLWEDFRTLENILVDGRFLNCNYFMKVMATTVPKSSVAMRQRKSSAPGSGGSAPSSPSNRPGSFMPSRTTESAETQRPNTLKLDHLPTLQRTQNNVQYMQTRRITTVESVSCCLSKNLNVYNVIIWCLN